MGEAVDRFAITDVRLDDAIDGAMASFRAGLPPLMTRDDVLRCSMVAAATFVAHAYAELLPPGEDSQWWDAGVDDFKTQVLTLAGLIRVAKGATAKGATTGH